MQVLLTERQEQAPLSEVEAAILRNSYFGQGSILLALQRYKEAIRVFSAATSRYQQSPETLEAFVQIADCYRRLNRPAEARGTLAQAEAVLAQLGDHPDFSRTTRYTREHWSQLLQWLGTL